ncbi:unnamed protein product [marine sediment metagenome]|uniref:Replication-associated protein ORF2/G2P domain-containing protein n=1 Tax=marine sediment metagenome TaxID=412755 RepID=X0ZH16_9ZZZZ
MSGGGTRREVSRFSKAARARLAFVAGNTEIEFTTMITLTYPKVFPCDGQTVKRHLNAFLTWMRRRSDGISYLWFLEFQKRGAPHIHVMLNAELPRKETEKAGVYREVALKWYAIVGSGDEKHLRAGTRTERVRTQDGARHYAVKYASKMIQKSVPPDFRNVGRFWGCSRDVPPKPQASIMLDDATARIVLDGWKWYRGDHFPIYHTLYNTNERFLEYINKVELYDLTNTELCDMLMLSISGETKSNITQKERTRWVPSYT